jgi:hypothetical protein
MIKAELQVRLEAKSGKESAVDELRPSLRVRCRSE